MVPETVFRLRLGILESHLLLWTVMRAMPSSLSQYRSAMKGNEKVSHGQRVNPHHSVFLRKFTSALELALGILEI